VVFELLSAVAVLALVTKGDKDMKNSTFKFVILFSGVRALVAPLAQVLRGKVSLHRV